MMNFAADDFDEIRKRMLKIKAPDFKSASGAPGVHCDYCVTPIDENCPIGCSSAYEKMYGISPHA